MKAKDKKKFISGTLVGFAFGMVILLSAAFFIAPGTLAAQVINQNLGATFGLGTAGLQSTVIKIIQWALGLLGLIAVIIIMYGGFVWMTAAGNQEKVQKAKKIIIRAVIGLVIILLAFAIVTFVFRAITNATNPTVSCTPGEIRVDGCAECNATGNGWIEHSEWPGCYLVNTDTFRVKWVDPFDGEGDVPLCSIVQVSFNGNISVGSVTGHAHLFVDATNAEVAGTWQVSSNPSIMEFLPAANYEQNTLYRVGLDGGASGITEDSASPRPFAGFTSWFTTGATTLATPPIVTAIYPADGTSNMCLNTMVEAIFSQKMRVSSINTSTVKFYDQTASADRNLRTPFSFPDAQTFITRPAEPLTAGSTYRATLVAGDPASKEVNNGIMDVCLNHLDGNANATSEGTAGSDDFLSVPSTNPTFPNEPWDFTADTDTTNTFCVPQLTAISPSDRRYDQGPITLTGSNLGLNGEVLFNQGIVDDSQCFNGLNYPAQACHANPWGTGTDVSVRVPAGPINYGGNSIPSNGAKDGSVSVSVGVGICKGGSNDLQSCTVPADCPGGSCVTDSNAVNLNVASPQINRISGLNNQPHGGTGQYVSLIKRSDGNAGFGTTPGRVWFRRLSDGAQVIADIPPCASYWQNNVLVIKVPSLAAIATACDPTAVGGWANCPVSSQVAVQVELNSSGIRSNLIRFIYTNEPAGPGLCSVTPQSCGTNGDARTLAGENFGTVADQVRFAMGATTVNAAIAAWANNNIGIAVPNVNNSNEPYLISVRKTVAGVTYTSNSLPFDVPCGGIPRVEEDTACGGHCNDAGAAACDNDTDCTGGVACIFDTITSPNPYKGATNVCLNASFGARFVNSGGSPVTMNGASLNSTNIFLEECTDNTAGCETAAVVASSIVPASDQFTLTPNLSLTQNQYYRLTIKLDVESDTHVKMNSDYTWVIKTKDDPAPCPLEKIYITPSNSTLGDIAPPAILGVSMASYAAQPIGPNCTGLNAAAYTWQWASSDASVATVSGSITSTETATALTKGTTYISAKAEDKEGKGKLTVSPDTCAFSSRPNYCADRNNDGTNECADSICDVAIDRCTPVVNNFNPVSGPGGTTVTVNGCYFGSYTAGTSRVDFGTQPAEFKCANSWTTSRIIATLTNSVALGNQLIEVKPAVWHCLGGTNDRQSCTVAANCPGGSCELVSTSDPQGSNQIDNIFTVNNLCNGQPVPASGVPGLCSVSPTSGKEGDTPINFSGFNLTNNPAPLTKAQFSNGTSGFIDSVTGLGGVTTYNNATVPVASQTGPARIMVNSCPSNTVDFGISCQTNADCSTGCCQSNICQPLASCAISGPGNLCVLTTNSPLCQVGSAVLDQVNYRCIDAAGHRDPNIPVGAAYPPVADADCRTCCYAGQTSSTGLACTVNQGACTGNNRGLYCGCTPHNDARCGNANSFDCGNDKCCYGRPTFTTDPAAGFISSCLNFSIRYTFTTGSSKVKMDQKTMYIGATEADSSIWVVDGVNQPIAGKLTTTSNGFWFSPTTAYNPGVTIHIRLRKDLVKDNNGIALSPIANDIDSRNWSVGAGAVICKIDHLASILSPSDLNYYCAKNDCLGDVDPSTDGNQHEVEIWAEDAQGNDLLNGVAIHWTEFDQADIFTNDCPQDLSVLQCLVTSNNKNGQGSLSFKADGTSSPLGNLGTATKQLPIGAFLCENPWPNPFAPDNESLPFLDSNLNFSLWYCRGNGTGSLLPELQQPSGLLMKNGSPVSGNNKNEMIREYFFQYRDPNESDDAIGIRVYENEEALSPLAWYREQFGPAAPEPQSLVVDGNPAVRAGRTVYVAAWNSSGGVLYPNIYLMSYNEGAADKTIQIYNQLLTNWAFNTNITAADKQALLRDMKRVNDLNDIYGQLLDYKTKNGAFPKLEGGTYISTASTSKWPSWQETLGAAAGGNLPVDPVNDLRQPATPTLCLAASGFDQNTCWSDSLKKFECPVDSHVYQYLSSPDGSNANLYAHLEYANYIGGVWLTGAAGTFDPCALAGLPNGSTCNCFNYSKLISGNASDHTGPVISAVDALALPPAVNSVSGSRAMNVTVDDGAGSGVNRVEFFVDGIRKLTDSNATDGWSWDFVSTQYANGQHTFLVSAYDNAGNKTDASFFIRVDNAGGLDGISPFVTITTPADGATLAGTTVAIVAQASDNRVVSSVQIQLLDSAGVPIGAALRTCNGTDDTMICSYVWDSSTVTNGSYKIRATATDSVTTPSSKEINITIDNTDAVAPTLSLGDIAGVCSIGTCNNATHDSCDYKTPCPGAFECQRPVCSQGTPCTAGYCLRSGSATVPLVIPVVAQDNNAVTNVQFYVDSVFRGNGTNIPPLPSNNWSWPWDTRGMTQGNCTGTCLAGGNPCLSDANCTAPDTCGNQGANFGTACNNDDECAAPGHCAGHQLTVIASDAHNNTAQTSLIVPIDVAQDDNTPPTVGFISPTPNNGTSVTGTINLRAAASDNYGVNRVNYYLDFVRRTTLSNGNCAGGADDGEVCTNNSTCDSGVCGWNWSLDTNPISAGWHTIQVDAQDAKGNRSDSAQIRVNVRGEGGPSITEAFVTPNTGSAGTVFTIQARVADTQGVDPASVIALIQSPDEVDLLPSAVNITLTRVSGDIYSGTYQGSWTSDREGAFYIDIRATDLRDNASELENIPGQALVTGNPPAIISPLTANGHVGSSFRYTIAATNAPTSFTAAPLPAGLSVNATTGVISGTPTNIGVTSVTITATNAFGMDTKTLVINIAAAFQNGVCARKESLPACTSGTPAICNSTAGCFWNAVTLRCAPRDCSVYGDQDVCEARSYCQWETS